jgi:chromosome segregation ATPase
MSDYWKKFKSVFVLEDEPKTKPQQPPAPKPAPEPSRSSPVAPSPAVNGTVNDRFVDILMNALQKSNQEGFDYMEYRQSLHNLKNMAMDEATRFKSAFAMAQTLGLTQAKLLDSGRFYLGVLEQEQEKFNNAHAQQRSKLVGEREKELEDLDAGILQRTAQIEQLQREIVEAQNRMQQIGSEIGTNTQKIENTRSDFEATFMAVYAQIQSDLSKIQQYIP